MIIKRKIDALLEQPETHKTIDEIERLIQKRKSLFRKHRENTFKAFDVWEKAVLRGRETDSNKVISWYQQMLDFPDEITVNTTSKDYPQIPKEILKYWRG